MLTGYSSLLLKHTSATKTILNMRYFRIGIIFELINIGSGDIVYCVGVLNTVEISFLNIFINKIKLTAFTNLYKQKRVNSPTQRMPNNFKLTTIDNLINPTSLSTHHLRKQIPLLNKSQYPMHNLNILRFIRQLIFNQIINHLIL